MKTETLVWGAIILSVAAIIMVVCEVPGHEKRIKVLESELSRAEKERRDSDCMMRIVLAAHPEIGQAIKDYDAKRRGVER